MSDTVSVTLLSVPLAPPLPDLTLAELRADLLAPLAVVSVDLTKPLAALAVAAKLSKLAGYDATVIVTAVQTGVGLLQAAVPVAQKVIADDDVMNVVLLGVNFCRSKGLTLAGAEAFIEAKIAKLEAKI